MERFASNSIVVSHRASVSSQVISCVGACFADEVSLLGAMSVCCANERVF